MLQGLYNKVDANRSYEKDALSRDHFSKSPGNEHDSDTPDQVDRVPIPKFST